MATLMGRGGEGLQLTIKHHTHTFDPFTFNENDATNGKI